MQYIRPLGLSYNQKTNLGKQSIPGIIKETEHAIFKRGDCLVILPIGAYLNA